MNIRLVASVLLPGLAAMAAERPNNLPNTANDLGCVWSACGEKRIATPKLCAPAAWRTYAKAPRLDSTSVRRRPAARAAWAQLPRVRAGQVVPISPDDGERLQ